MTELTPCRHWVACGDPAAPLIRCDLGRGAPAECPRCSAYDAGSRVELPEIERTRCEVWTRVMGYHRPVSAFNPGKRAEHDERVLFREHPSGARRDG